LDQAEYGEGTHVAQPLADGAGWFGQVGEQCALGGDQAGLTQKFCSSKYKDHDNQTQ